MKILALLDGRPGNDNQTIAIAEALGAYETLKVEFGFWALLPNFLLGKSLIGVTTPINSKADLVIASGRKLARVAANIKAKTGCKAVQLMHPQINLANFNLVFLPEHDGISATQPQNIRISGYSNSGIIHTTIGAPNRVDASMLKQHEGKFPDGINVALIGDIEPRDVAKLGKISNLHITTSRRTKPATIEALNAIHPHYIYIWERRSENPYYALLAAAKNIIVSADSVGMISEACTTGKNVYVFARSGKKKFRNFIVRLIKEGCVKPISDFGASWTAKKLSTRDDVVRIIIDSL